MNITPDHVRAARAFLGLTIRDLAARTGLTEASISNFETGRTAAPSSKTIETITRALTAEGIIFESDGIRRVRNAVIWLPLYTDLLDDILDRRPDEALFINADDEKSSLDVIDRVRRIRDAGIAMRFLVPPAARTISGDPACYRRSDMLAARDVTVIYGSRVALWTPDGVMVIVSDFLATDYRLQFEAFWNHAQKI